MHKEAEKIKFINYSCDIYHKIKTPMAKVLWMSLAAEDDGSTVEEICKRHKIHIQQFKKVLRRWYKAKAVTEVIQDGISRYYAKEGTFFYSWEDSYASAYRK
jgi:F0F1-type ATP synthase delta subunit